MAMSRMPSHPDFFRTSIRTPVFRPLHVLLTFLCALTACQADDDKLLNPGDAASNVVTAVYISPEEFRRHEIKMDGEAKDTEWGGALDAARAYTQVRLTGGNGAGD
jgi:hypothetical protein